MGSDGRFEALVRAAEEVLVSDPRSAAGVLRRAIEIATPEERTTLHVRHVLAWQWAGHLHESIAAAELARADPLDFDTATAITTGLAAAHRLLEDPSTACAVIGSSDASAASAPIAARFHLEASFTYMRAFDMERAWAEAERARQVGGPSDRRVHAVSYAAQAQIALLQLRSSESARLASLAAGALDENGDSEDGHPVRGIVATAWLLSGDLDRAVATLEAAIDEAERTGRTWYLPNHLDNLASARFHRGEWDAALDASRGAHAAAAASRRPLARGGNYALTAIIASLRDDESTTQAALAPYESGEAMPGGASIGWAAARHAEDIGDSARARDIARRIAPTLGTLDLLLAGPDMARWLGPDCDEHVVNRLHDLAARADVDNVRAVAAWTEGNARREPEPVVRAAESGALPPALRWHADLDAGRWLLEVGDVARATRHLEAAEHGFERVGATVALRRIRRLLRTAGVRRGATGKRDGEGPLTTAEQVVLDLVREGHTNAEIAARLHVSKRTVESHVSSLLRKLGAANRLGLVARR